MLLSFAIDSVFNIPRGTVNPASRPQVSVEMLAMGVVSFGGPSAVLLCVLAWDYRLPTSGVLLPPIGV